LGGSDNSHETAIEIGYGDEFLWWSGIGETYDGPDSTDVHLAGAINL
jgi:hypothetical protein